MKRTEITIHPSDGDLAELHLSGAVRHLLADWLDLSRVEAQSLQSSFITPEHVALACLGSGLVVLNAEHRITHAAYRTQLLEIVGLGLPGLEGVPIRPGPLLNSLLAPIPDGPMDSAALFRTVALAQDGLARRVLIRSQR